ncbi:CRISPR-associated protein, Csy3 family [Desulfonatronospira thiodismutans ASO3-1]|uniref:CRISPR-associated protein, Csy3 family n=1 Tax=Desulfonatronospira thiodismutans ASO3-1 TaxID=555779 RepID=D6SNR7_9BACT|nr:type I-F CRISPR-associated protein Csy3 [Desulfonatronospira thiodismutans]EFI34393.1 CRISPR-associated protein, Csy3 family [Desulfonatronospira thiodismutans ASO3-1]
MSIGNLPKLLSFQRGVAVSDGLMYNYTSKPQNGYSKVRVVRHGIRGTQNVSDASKEKLYQVQVTESAKTEANAEGLVIRFSFGLLPLKNLLFSSSEKSFSDHCQAFAERFGGSEELMEISCRYARNVLNGRWFYRNSELESGRQITVKFLPPGSETKDLPEADGVTVQSATSLGFRNDYTADEKKLGAEICKCLKGESKTRFHVEGVIKFGMKGVFEVFPSQNYVSSKPKGFARPLYKVGVVDSRELSDILKDSDPSSFRADMISMGHAALRDQKIGNALRVIDTWYERGDDMTPIAVEPNGASLKDNHYYRKKNGSAFVLMKKIDEMQPGNGELNKDAMFLLATMIRGGVFSG